MKKQQKYILYIYKKNQEPKEREVQQETCVSLPFGCFFYGKL